MPRARCAPLILHFKFIACGSSGPQMPTYLEWDREVLEQCYDYVDGLSLHRYFGNTHEETGGDSSEIPGDEPEHGEADRGDDGGL